jgi:hypothetical protein
MGLFEFLSLLALPLVNRDPTNGWWNRSVTVPWRSALQRFGAATSAVLLTLGSALVMVATASLVPSNQSELSGPSAVRASAAGVAAVRRLELDGPFRLDIAGGPTADFARAVLWSVAYSLFVSGESSRVESALALNVNPALASKASEIATVVIVLHRGGGVSASLR